MRTSSTPAKGAAWLRGNHIVSRTFKCFFNIRFYPNTSGCTNICKNILPICKLRSENAPKKHPQHLNTCYEVEHPLLLADETPLFRKRLKK